MKLINNVHEKSHLSRRPGDGETLPLSSSFQKWSSQIGHPVPTAWRAGAVHTGVLGGHFLGEISPSEWGLNHKNLLSLSFVASWPSIFIDISSWWRGISNGCHLLWVHPLVIIKHAAAVMTNKFSTKRTVWIFRARMVAFRRQIHQAFQLWRGLGRGMSSPGWMTSHSQKAMLPENSCILSLFQTTSSSPGALGASPYFF